LRTTIRPECDSPARAKPCVNSAENELDFPRTTAPEAGATVMLRPGPHGLRMPSPFGLDHGVYRFSRV